MPIKSWRNRVLQLTNESQFFNLRTSYEQPKFLQLDHISAASKTQNKQTKFFHGCHLYIYWSHGRLVSYSSLFLPSLHLHHLLPMILHESGSQHNWVFMITGPRYVNSNLSKCLLTVTIAVYSSDWKGRQLGNTISIWNALKFAVIFASKVNRGNTNDLQNVN